MPLNGQGSDFTYNDVDLGQFILTKAVDVDLEMDPSGVDPLYQHITVAIQAVINGDDIGMPALEWFNKNYPKLTMPRKKLSHKVNGKTIFTTDGTKDAKNGPIPKSFRIVQIDGSESIIVLFTIETWLHICEDGSTPQNILSHRWRETVSRDESFLATWTRTGTVIFRSAVGDPDDMRGTFYPPILTGFKRISNEFTIDESGTRYSYSIRDQEQYLNPPISKDGKTIAVKARGTFAVSSANNARVLAECRVHLEGAKDAKRSVLMQMALIIALSKIAGEGNRRPVPLGGSVQEELWSNSVDVVVRSQWSAGAGRAIKGLALVFTGIGVNPVGSDAKTPAVDKGPYGLSGVQVISAQILDWCQKAEDDVDLDIEQRVKPTGKEQKVPVALKTGTVPNQDSAGDYNQTEADPIYTTYAVNKEYEDAENILSLPVASSKAGSDSSIVQIAQPQKQLRVTWSAERIGSPPDTPSITPTNSNVILAGFGFQPLETALESDGTTKRYSITGWILYAFKKGNQVDFNAGVPPWIKGITPGQVTYKTTGKKGIIGTEA